RSTDKPPRRTANVQAPQTSDKKKIALLARKLSEAVAQQKAASKREMGASRELADALEREKATSEVLGTISSVPSELEPGRYATACNSHHRRYLVCVSRPG